MREIKFRAWDPYRADKGIMLENHTLYTIGLTGLFDMDFLKWMQYTGIKDSTGKEIYEGDIISLEDVHEGYPYSGGIIEYDSDHGRYAVKISGGYYPINNFRRITVIGNIYENEK